MREQCTALGQGVKETPTGKPRWVGAIRTCFHAQLRQRETERGRERQREADRQTGRQTGRQAGRQTDRQTDRQTETETKTEAKKKIKATDRWTDLGLNGNLLNAFGGDRDFLGF